MGALIGAMCTGICCSACRECEGQKFGMISRVPYIFLFFISGVFSIVMSLYGTKALNLEFYTTSICNSSTCTGNGSVYRVSFMLFIFELLHVFIIGAGIVSFHYLWFIIKFIIFTACLVLTFIVGDSSHSNAFFQGYADYFARFISGIYLFLQILIFISYGHKINEYLQEKGNDANTEPSDSKRSRSIDTEARNNSCNKYFVVLGLATFALYAISLTLCGFFFKWYALDQSCGFHKTIISLTICMVLINFIISAGRGDGSLFVSAIVSFYVTFLCLSALQTTNDITCNVFAEARGVGSLWIGFGFLFISIFYAAFTADKINVLWEKDDDEYILMDNGDNIDMSLDDKFDKKSTKKQKKNKRKIEKKSGDSGYDDIVNDHEISIDSKESNVTDVKEKEPSKRTQRISNSYFHFILALASCYFAMLLTDWGTGTQITSTGKQSMWVNIVTQYATSLLFWWTLLAPVICPNRFKQNDDE